MFYSTAVLKIFAKALRKTPAMESFFNKNPWHVTSRKGLHWRQFPVNLAKLSRTTFDTEDIQAIISEFVNDVVQVSILRVQLY